MGQLKNQYIDAGYPERPGWKTPGPSQQAAQAITGRARTLRDRVFAYIKSAQSAGRPAPTADEIAAGLDVNLLSIRPRVSELRRLGEIVEAAERGRNASGMSAGRWVPASERGRP
jgi:hypothetical protein